MLSKEECEVALENLKIQHDYLASNMHYNYPFSIEMLKKVQYCFEELITEHFELVKEYKDVRKELECYYEMMSNPQTYKFEDLKEGMWVWDRKRKKCIEVCPEYPFVCLEYNAYEDEYEEIKFEENRFYPVQMANVRCEKDDE